MHGLAVFLHVAGIAVWLGASLTFMVFGPAARGAPLATWAHTWTTLARVQRVLVAPAALIATVTGLLLTMALARSSFAMGSATWLMVMQGTGLVAGVLSLAFATPLANRMARIAERSAEKGQVEPGAEQVRKALAVVSSVSGVLMLVALYFGVVR